MLRSPSSLKHPLPPEILLGTISCLLAFLSLCLPETVSWNHISYWLWFWKLQSSSKPAQESERPGFQEGLGHHHCDIGHIWYPL